MREGGGGLFSVKCPDEGFCVFYVSFVNLCEDPLSKPGKRKVCAQAAFLSETAHNFSSEIRNTPIQCKFKHSETNIQIILAR